MGIDVPITLSFSYCAVQVPLDVVADNGATPTNIQRGSRRVRGGTGEQCVLVVVIVAPAVCWCSERRGSSAARRTAFSCVVFVCGLQQVVYLCW